MTEFTILNIKTISDGELSLNIKTGVKSKYYNLVFTSQNSMSLSDELEILMRHKNFNYYREFAKVVSDFQAGRNLHFPIVLFDKKIIKNKELQAA